MLDYTEGMGEASIVNFRKHQDFRPPLRIKPSPSVSASAGSARRLTLRGKPEADAPREVLYPGEASITNARKPLYAAIISCAEKERRVPSRSVNGMRPARSAISD